MFVGRYDFGRKIGKSFAKRSRQAVTLANNHLNRNIYEEKTDDFAATPALEGSGTTDCLF
ncbi:hypothetical protein JCM16496A_38390 [Bacteroides rodentium JCM 16496]